VRPYVCLAYCLPFNNNVNHFGRFHLHKKDKNTVSGLHRHNHSCKRSFCYVCLIKLLHFLIPQTTCNVQYQPERSKSAIFKKRFYFIYHVSCVSWWKLRTAYRPFAYSVPSNAPTPWILYTKRGGGHNHIIIKDARSVSLYPYNWSQILQYVKYTK